MKTTNYLISKQLAEEGFDQKFPPAFYHVNLNGTLKYRTAQKGYSREKGIFHVESYDLETILEALPNFIANKNKGENCLTIDVAFGEIHYEGDSDNEAMFITTTEVNESLADTAARLWLKLKKENLI